MKECEMCFKQTPELRSFIWDGQWVKRNEQFNGKIVCHDCYNQLMTTKVTKNINGEFVYAKVGMYMLW